MRPGGALAAAATLGLTLVSGAAQADAPTTASLRLKDHKFTPSVIRVPANRPSLIALTNADPLAEEFDSTSLKIEKVVGGGQTGTVRLRPLKPGRYPFMGEYHSATAQGVVIAQ